jgi:membrane-associated phospholipid phosphatase
MKRIVNENRLYWALAAILLLSGALLQVFFSAEEIFLFVNRHNHPLADAFFSYYTNIGDGIFFAVFLLVLACVSFRMMFTGIAAMLLSTAFSWLFKQVLFADALRPVKYFEGVRQLYTVPGVHVHMHNSFPSGHTITAFTVFTLAALFLSGRRGAAATFFAMALLAGFSRMYLAQHFFADVYFGMIIGLMSAAVPYYFLYQRAPYSGLIRNKKSLLELISR